MLPSNFELMIESQLWHIAMPLSGGRCPFHLINSTNVMKCEAHGTQQPGHINPIGEGVSTAQRSNSLVQLINQRFPSQSAAVQSFQSCLTTRMIDTSSALTVLAKPNRRTSSNMA